MENVNELFKQGKYETIISKLTKQTTHHSLLDQLSRDNSLIICEYANSPHGKDCVHENNCLLRLSETLLKCSSVPSQLAILSLELTTLYNYLYIYVKHNHDDCTGNLSVFRLINRTMYRVCSLLPGYERRRVSLAELNPDSKSTCNAVMTVCLNTMQFGMECTGISSIFGPFSDCCRLIFLLPAFSKDCNLACTHLKKLKKLEENLESLADRKVLCEKHLSLKFAVDHQYMSLTQSSRVFLTSFLIGCFQCKSDQWEDGIKSMDHASGNEDLKLAANVTSGYGLYKLQRYSEAISVLLETIRSYETITQRLKASIYNLIGMCFENMGKGQLSIQMYKEALSADFGFLRPLFNTSLQYRKLAISDVELECLNLLVTALEMREKGAAKEDGIDLLSILTIHDDDITYLEALYTFAYRSLQLQRYTVAADKYKHLLTYHRSWETKDYTSVPSVLQIHHEAILALLRANQLTDCLSLCDKVITCYHGQDQILDFSLTFSGNCLDNSIMTSSARQNSSCLEDSVTNLNARRGSVISSGLDKSTRKRKRLSDSFTEGGSLIGSSDNHEELHCGNNLYDEDVVACKYKADVLFKLGQHDSALASAQRAVDSISSYKRKLFTMKGERFLSSPCTPSQRVSKKPRLTSESHSTEESMHSSGDKQDSMETTESQSTEIQMRSLCQKLHQHSSSFTLEFELYTLMAKILREINKPGDAMHFQRLAAQIEPLNTVKT